MHATNHINADKTKVTNLLRKQFPVVQSTMEKYNNTLINVDINN